MLDVGQMIMGTFNGPIRLDGPDTYPGGTSCPSFKALLAGLAAGQVGNVILFNWKWHGYNYKDESNRVKINVLEDAVYHIRQACQNPEKPVPLIGVDQEGGEIQRFGAPLTKLLTPEELGDAPNDKLARETGIVAGAELAFLGLNLNLAPGADLRFDRTYISSMKRAFHREPSVTASRAVAYAQGLKQSGVLSCAKHAPGHGRTRKGMKGNSHEWLPRITTPRSTLVAEDLVPFSALVAGGTKLVMAGHLLVTDVDNTAPFSLSAVGINDLLRGELGFTGVVISDDLEIMDGVRYEADLATGCPDETRPRTIPDIVRLGLRAGIDIFLVQFKWQEYFLALKAIADAGEAAAPTVEQQQDYARLQAALQRIALLKQGLAAWNRHADPAEELDKLQRDGNFSARVAKPGEAVTIGNPKSVPAPASSSIDYGRAATVPFGLAPHDLEADQIRAYFQMMDAQAAFVEYTSPVDDDRDPGPLNAMQARRVVNTAGVDVWPTPLVRRSCPQAINGAPVTTTQDIDAAALDSVADARWIAVDGEPPSETLDRIIERVRWDVDAREVAPFLMPYYPDGVLAVAWNHPRAAAPAPFDKPLVGALDDDPTAPYVLRTTGVGDGEADPELLRSPVAGSVRFLRYRVVMRDAAGALTTGHWSTSGRLEIEGALLRLMPTFDKKFLDGSPLLEPLRFVWDHVDVASVAETLGPVIWSQILSREALLNHERFKRDRRMRRLLFEHFRRILRIWSAWTTYWSFTDVTRIAGPFTQLRNRIPLVGFVSEQILLEILAEFMADDAAKASLKAFVIKIYANMLVGEFSAPNVLENADLRVLIESDFVDAHPNSAEVLIDMVRTPGRWTPCFAGCPLGKGALACLDPGADPSVPPSPARVLREGLMTTDREALLVAGRAVTLPVAGRFAAFRLPRNATGVPYSERDFLEEITVGHKRHRNQAPTIDFEPYADEDHPLSVGTTMFDDIKEGRRWRGAMDQLRVLKVDGGISLQRANIQWWTDNVEFNRGGNPAYAGQWPTIPADTPPPGFTGFKDPTPRAPYKDGRTRHPYKDKDGKWKQALSGFDEWDLGAFERARRHVTTAKGTPPLIPVMMALAEKEGYRIFADMQRQGKKKLIKNALGWDSMHNKFRIRNATAPHANPPIPEEYVGFEDFEEIYPRNLFLFWSYGLDHMIFKNPPSPITPKELRYLEETGNLFNSSLAKLILPDGTELLKRVGPLRDPDRYIRDRVKLITKGPTTRTGPTLFFTQRLTRDLQWIGIAIQYAWFEFLHHQLHTQDGYPAVDEFVAAEVPDRGSGPNDPKRKQFIAYYALLYMAFNLMPQTTSAWISLAKAHLAANPALVAAGEKVSTLLLFKSTFDPPPNTWIPIPPSGDYRRHSGQRGHMALFAASLDAYLRLLDGTKDANPADRNW